MLLSRISEDPTVGGLRGEKEKRSTQGRLRVDSRIGSFFKLLKVGFSPYLGFIPIFSTLLMFRLNEAVRGRLIGPRTWDRIIRNSLGFFSPSVTVQKYLVGMGCLSVVCVDLCIECLLGIQWAGNGRGFRVH